MAKITSPKQTGGGGFDFEDKVSAIFLAGMLCQIPGFAKLPGIITKISYQSRPEGWLLDDLLITLDESGQKHQVAVSVKSNRQITANGIPDGLLLDIWRQYLGVDDQVFDADQDFLMLVVSPLARSVMTDLSELIHRSKETEISALVSRLKTTAFSKKLKTLFAGFDCPDVLKISHSVDQNAVFRLLSRLVIVEFDFQTITNKDYSACVRDLQRLLRSQDYKEAERLFAHLSGIRREIAKYGGDVSYNKLIRSLTAVFDLKGAPVHSPDWNKIIRTSISRFQTIPSLIGGNFKINRSQDKANLNDLFAKFSFVFLLGKSGFGKSVLAKEMAEEAIASGNKVIWINASLLGFGSIENTLQFRHSLDELLSVLPGAGHLLVIDGADRFYKDTLIEELAPVLRSVLEIGLPEWRIIVTCQSEEHDRVLRQFQRNNIPVVDSTAYEISPILQLTLIKATVAFPPLVNLIRHDHLVKLFSNLKFLDLVVLRINAGNANRLEDEIGETALIDWIWEEEILNSSDNGSMNSRFLQALAERQANDLSNYTPVTNFDIAESGPLNELKRLNLVSEQEDRIAFIHDLFGDWARYKIIRSKGAKAKEFITSLDLISPLWCKAIRLYGVHLLEKKGNSEQWLELFLDLKPSDPSEQIIRALLLESIIFSNNVEIFLENLWTVFEKKEGAILKQFLTQFLFRATIPNPAVLRLAESFNGITVSQLATLHRIPIYNYWPAILAYLTKHAQTVTELARGKCMEIVQLWLMYIQESDIYRKQAARIALDIATWYFNFKLEGGFSTNKSGKVFFIPFLYGFNEFPEEAEDLALKLCRRKEFEKTDKWIRRQASGSLMGRRIKGTLTEHGPSERVDDEFQEACLQTPAMIGLFRNHPELSKEILLALLIAEPSTDYTDRSYFEEYGLNDIDGWTPAFYTKGPFLQFLRLQPIKAIETIVELCNFATQNWLKGRRDDENVVTRIELVLEDQTIVSVFGDANVYDWSRDTGAPKSLASALMALEKFLLEESELTHDITPYLELILGKSHSVATFAILSSVGKANLNYFTGVLKPLLAVYELIEWEMGMSYSGFFARSQLQAIGLFDAETLELSRKWNSLPQRKFGIERVAFYLNLTHADIQLFYQQAVIPKWKTRLQRIADDGMIDPYLMSTIAQLDKDNYVPVVQGDITGIQYQEPDTLSEELAEVRASNDEPDLIIFASRIQQRLEENVFCSVEELNEIWEHMQYFHGLRDKDNDQYTRLVASNVFAGMAAIILNRHVNDPVKQSEYIDWCLSHLEQTWDRYALDYRNISSLPTVGAWDVFSAKITVALFLDDEDNPVNRKILARIVLHARNPTVEKLFLMLSQHYPWYSPVFVQIQNLFLERCRLLHNLPITIWDYSSVDFEALFLSAQQQFISGEIPVVLADLTKLGTNKKQKSSLGLYQHYDYFELIDPGLSLNNLIFAFSSLPVLSPELDDQTFVYVRSLYDQLIRVLIYTWGEIEENRLQINDFTGIFDRWFATHLVQALGMLENEEICKSLWQPLFAYGNVSHRWLEFFSQQILLLNMHKSDIGIIGKNWNEMIDYAFKCQMWGTDNRNFHNGASLWHSLLAIDGYGLNLWKSGYPSLMQVVHKQMLRWFGKLITSEEEVVRLMALATSPSSVFFFKTGIVIVELHLKYQGMVDEREVPAGLVRNHFSHDDEVAKMCSYIWERHHREMINDHSLFDQFKSILLYLLAKQNPVGLELHGRLISR